MRRQNGTQNARKRVSIQEASRLLNRSEKTIRRMVHQDRLHPVLVNRKFLFDVEELEAVIEAEQPGPTLESEVAALRKEVQELREQVSDLEEQVKALRSRPYQYEQKPAPVRVIRESAGPATPLPDGLIALSEMVKRHHVPETSVRRAVEHGALPVVRGSWPGGVKQAIAAEGHAKFYDLYHERPGFERCDQCPHL